MINKGIILAGGSGTRLSPLTKAVNKQLLPIYDKPLIFYPLSILMLANIKNILMIVNPGQIENFKSLLGDGKRFGIKIQYKIQKKPRGLADAFILGKNFIKKDNVALILGDNFFYGQSLTDKLEKSLIHNKGARIFLKNVKAKISIIDSEDIYITSDFANYNSKNYDTNFFENIKIKYADHKIDCEYLDLLFNKNIAILNKNIVYKSLETNLLADRMEIDLITKNSKISMKNKKDKIEIVYKK